MSLYGIRGGPVGLKKNMIYNNRRALFYAFIPILPV